MILELTSKERAKVVLKRFLAIGFNLLGGFYFARLVTKPGVTIITYHRIIDDMNNGIHSYISVAETDFRRQVKFFKKNYTVISLNEAIDRIRRNLVDRHYLVITFDDGYKDNYSLGLEIFQSEAIHPTIFVTTGCVDKQEPLWPDKVRQLLYNAKLLRPLVLPDIQLVVEPEVSGRPRAVRAVIAHLKKMDTEARDKYLADLRRKLGKVDDSGRLMLNWDEVRKLSESGVDIGAHTVNHPVLAKVSEQASALEINGSKEMLEKKIGKQVTLFAYPNGTATDFTETTIDQVKTAGYEAAATTIRGVNRGGSDLFRLRRTGVYLTDSLSDLKLKLALESLLLG